MLQIGFSVGAQAMSLCSRVLRSALSYHCLSHHLHWINACCTLNGRFGVVQAHKVCPSDPLACNELGVLTYKNQQYSAAEQWLLRALELVPGRLNAGQYAPDFALDPCSCSI